MDDTITSLLIIGALFIPVCLAAIGLVIAFVLLIRRNTKQAGGLKTRWAAIAQTHGLTFNPGTTLADPSLSGTIDGLTVTLTPTRYQMGGSGMNYSYTTAWVPVAAAGELLIADRKRSHHVGGVAGAEVAIPEPGLAVTHLARGNPDLLAGLLTPELMARLSQNAITHVRLAENRLRVQRPGHQSGEGPCLDLMRLAADLAQRL